MWIDLPLAEPLQPAAGHEALAGVFASCVLKALMVDVNRGHRFGGQDPFAPPVPEEAGRSRVAIVDVVVARFIAIENQTNNIGRVCLVELALQVGANHVVRRRNDLRQRTDVLEIVTQSTKGLNLGHEIGTRGSG
jgi:hypothetical protein